MKKITLLCGAVLWAVSSFSQSYDECVADFKTNKYAEAITGLEKLANSGTDNKNVYLLLCMAQANQGHYSAAFSAFEQFYAKADDPYPYFYALNNPSTFNSRDKNVRSLLEKMMNDPRANMTTRELLMDDLAAYQAAAGDFDDVRETYSHMGDVKNWSTVGVFENVSGSGFNKDFDVLAHPEGNYVFKNHIGANVKWFDITAVRNDRWYDFEYHYNVDNSIIYAQTFINSTEDKEVLLKAGVSGSLKVWLNDMLIGAEPEERNTNSDVYTYQVKLQKGVNRLLVQVGSSELNRSNFMVRLATLDGQLIEDVSSEAQYKPYTKAAPYTVKKTPLFAEKYFEDKLAASADDKFINELLLISVYNKNQNKTPAYHILKLLKNEAPNCTYIADKAIVLANVDDNKIGASKERELIKTYGPETADGLVLRYYDATNKEKWDDALALLDKYTALYGENESIALSRIYILSKKKENQKFLDAIDEAYEKYPASHDAAMEKYQVVLNGSKDIRAANNILLKHVKKNFDVKAIATIRDNDFKIGEREEGKKWYRALIASNPVAVGWYRGYAEVLYEMNDYDAALTQINKAIELSPYMGQYYEIKAEILQAMHNKENAEVNLHNAIRYSPTDFSARKKLNDLEGKKDMSDYCVENDITKIVAAEINDRQYDDEDAAILLNDKKEFVYPEPGAVIEQNELLVLIKSSKGIEEFKEFNLPYSSGSQRLIVDKAELVKVDGNKVPADRKNGKCVFSSMQVGDVMHVSYKMENAYKGELAAHFWENFTFNSTFPVKTARFSLVVPASKTFAYKVMNTKIEPVIKEIDNNKLYIWEENDRPKVIAEPAMSADVREQLVISSLPDWNYVANWYSDLSYIKTQADPQVKEKVQELLAGNERKTDFEKARILYNYIEENFHYSSVPFLHSALVPQRASRTLLSKLGDCKDLATLFVSMAREAGLDANLVLVSTRGEDLNEFELPTIGFNHCIAQLHCDRKDYLVELTNDYLPFTAMASSLINAEGLFIPKDGGKTMSATAVKLSSPAAPLNINVRTAEVTLNDDKGLIHRHVYKIGSESATLRIHYRDINEKEKIKALAESMNKEFNKNVTLGAVKFTGEHVLSDTAEIDYDFTVDNFASTIVGMKVIRLPWTESYNLSQIFSLDKRNYAMELWPLTAVPASDETIMVKIPAGKKLAEKPADVTLSCPFMSYTVKYQVTADKVIAKRELKYLKDNVKPEEYAEVKAMVARMTEADNKEMAFK